ncbi:hypothetical protein WICPIJ_000439 [Wickerhamomyces pijperi]|uniref:Uncharacterized protein n=1 Tax=Wickerhamomyces pijperi TaxID=599730 RepID=A0A9P8TRZ2_WICPI|nr:hypothetical protein WICPIJ_000439 [Wickerhamomyces pijperi]
MAGGLLAEWVRGSGRMVFVWQGDGHRGQGHEVLLIRREVQKLDTWVDESLQALELSTTPGLDTLRMHGEQIGPLWRPLHVCLSPVGSWLHGRFGRVVLLVPENTNHFALLHVELVSSCIVHQPRFQIICLLELSQLRLNELVWDLARKGVLLNVGELVQVQSVLDIQFLTVQRSDGLLHFSDTGELDKGEPLGLLVVGQRQVEVNHLPAGAAEELRKDFGQDRDLGFRGNWSTVKDQILRESFIFWNGVFSFQVGEVDVTDVDGVKGWLD